jgi:hypothetical protein
VEEKDLLAPCGLDCSTCSIFRAKDDPRAMKEILDWFVKERGVELPPEKVRCGGCLGDRSIHWSAGCDILKCSVDERGLQSCSACPEMPCERLEKWATYGARYAGAVNRLKRMKMS